MQRGLAVNVALAVPISFVWWYTGDILAALAQVRRCHIRRQEGGCAAPAVVLIAVTLLLLLHALARSPRTLPCSRESLRGGRSRACLRWPLARRCAGSCKWVVARSSEGKHAAADA